MENKKIKLRWFILLGATAVAALLLILALIETAGSDSILTSGAIRKYTVTYIAIGLISILILLLLLLGSVTMMKNKPSTITATLDGNLNLKENNNPTDKSGFKSFI